MIRTLICSQLVGIFEPVKDSQIAGTISKRF